MPWLMSHIFIAAVFENLFVSRNFEHRLILWGARLSDVMTCYQDRLIEDGLLSIAQELREEFGDSALLGTFHQLYGFMNRHLQTRHGRQIERRSVQAPKNNLNIKKMTTYCLIGA
jgi:hypothetical protein